MRIRQVKRLPKRDQMAQGMSPGTQKGAPKVNEGHRPHPDVVIFGGRGCPKYLRYYDTKYLGI